MLRREINIFFTAIMFYTRIPVPKQIGFSNDILNKSTRYLPLVGIIVGAIGASVFLIINIILPLQLAIILSMATTIFITGAFHEDAFSDFCDGFGGGYTCQRILEIMKDSRIGTYGAVGIITMLLTKYLCLVNIRPSDIPLILINAHAFSRLLPVCFIYTSKYVREDALSKSKPIGHRGSIISFCVATIFGTVLLIRFPWQTIVLVVSMSLLLFAIFRLYVIKKIGGYTGDVLGALQQLAEIIFYIGFLVNPHNLA